VAPDHRLYEFERPFVGQKRHPFHHENRSTGRNPQQFGRGQFRCASKIGFSRPGWIQLIAALQNLVKRILRPYRKTRHAGGRNMGGLNAHRLAAASMAAPHTVRRKAWPGSIPPASPPCRRASCGPAMRDATRFAVLGFNWDTSIMKNFNISKEGQWKLQLRAE